MPQFIDDGYTRDDGFIKGAEPSENGETLYDSLSFHYRVATKAEWLRLDNQIEILEEKKLVDPDCSYKQEKLLCEFVAKHLFLWDLRDRKQAEVPISADTCMRLNNALLGRLYRIIRGVQTSDPKPKAEPKISDSDQEKN